MYPHLIGPHVVYMVHAGLPPDKRQLDRFNRFCSDDQCNQHTDRQTGRQTYDTMIQLAIIRRLLTRVNNAVYRTSNRLR